MKKIFILIVSLGLLYPDRPFAQNSICLLYTSDAADD